MTTTNDDIIQLKSYSKKELRQISGGISKDTFRAWSVLAGIYDEETKWQKILNPKKVKQYFDHHGIAYKE